MTLTPPTARTSYGFDFAQHAGKGLTLLVCDDCDNVIYPHRELCSSCLGDTLSWRNIESGATLLAKTMLARSFDEWFTEQLPWLLVSVRLKGGASLICHAHPELDSFENTSVNKVYVQVYVQVCRDAGGCGVLVAMPEAAANEKFEFLDAALNWRIDNTQETRSGEQ